MKLFLVSPALAFLCLLQSADAGVTWLASDDGTDLTLTTDGGSLTYLSSFSSTTAFASQLAGSGTVVVSGSLTSSNSSLKFFAGTLVNVAASPVHPFSAATPLVGSGSRFGFTGDNLVLPVGSPDNGTITPISSITFSNETIATAFGTSLDAGPLLLWTATTGGTNTISIAKVVPEPSSAFTAALGLAALGIRRRRK